MRTTIITKLALVALLTMFVGSCQKQNKTGEAFVVLKSGEVIYMADMEVVCLKPSFKADFNGWRTEYENQDKALVRAVETGNPTAKVKLKEIDDSIAELKAKVSGMSGDEKTISDSLAHAHESERDKLVAEMAKKNDVRQEYRQIIEPIDKRIEELDVEIDKVKQEKKALTTETIQNINTYIVESKLTVPKLETETADSLFSTSTDMDEKRRSKPFLVERRPRFVEGWYDWVYFYNIPSELEGTQCDSVIKAAYKKWLHLESRSQSTDGDLSTQKTRRKEQLIPWQNRHGLTQSEGQNLVELEEQQKASLARLNESLSVFNAGGVEARSLVQNEIRKRVSKLNESLALLNQQRRDVLQDTAERTRNELKAEYRQRFYELVKKDAVAAVRTGSKGDFIVSGEASYLYAATLRDNGERLAWLVRLDPSSTKVKMSVSNTASAGGYGDFDEFWMLRWKLD